MHTSEVSQQKPKVPAAGGHCARFSGFVGVGVVNLGVGVCGFVAFTTPPQKIHDTPNAQLAVHVK